MWVLWAHASSTARLEQSFRDIADRVKIEGRQDSQVNMFKLVHDWLCDTDERWLLVLDNVDDAGFLFDVQAATSNIAAKPLHEYLPYCAHGCVVITTRNKEAALQLVEQRDMIALNPMNALEARTLLAKKLGVQAASDIAIELTELATILEHMPLALVQAAAYLSQRAPLCSVAQFCAVRDVVHTDATKIVEMVGLLKAVDEAVKNLRENRSAQLRRPEFGGLILEEVCSFAYVAGAFDRRDGLLAREHMRKGDETA
jgi:hypothetical protein